jgi:hypothetical protein
MQKTTKNIEEISNEIHKLISNYLETNQIPLTKFDLSFHKVPTDLFNDNLNCKLRKHNDVPYLVYTKEINKSEFTYFSKDLI